MVDGEPVVVGLRAGVRLGVDFVQRLRRHLPEGRRLAFFPGHHEAHLVVVLKEKKEPFD